MSSLLVACEKEIEFSEEISSPKITVNSGFMPDSLWKVEISRSLSIIDNGQLSDIENANVSIVGSDGSSIVLNYDSQNKYYTSNSLVATNINYIINVSAPNFNDVSASGFAPSPININNVNKTIQSISDETIYNFRITFNDPPSSEDFYMIEINKQEVYYIYDVDSTILDSTSFENPTSLSSRDVSADQREEFTNQITFSDQLFNGQEKTLSVMTYDYIFDIGSLADKTNYEIKLYRLSKDYYLYKRSILAYRNVTGNPFAEPVRVFINVEGGFGIFAGLSYSNFLVE